MRTKIFRGRFNSICNSVSSSIQFCIIGKIIEVYPKAYLWYIIWIILLKKIFIELCQESWTFMNIFWYFRFFILFFLVIKNTELKIMFIQAFKCLFILTLVLTFENQSIWCRVQKTRMNFILKNCFPIKLFRGS